MFVTQTDSSQLLMHRYVESIPQFYDYPAMLFKKLLNLLTTSYLIYIFSYKCFICYTNNVFC